MAELQFGVGHGHQFGVKATIPFVDKMLMVVYTARRSNYGRERYEQEVKLKWV